MNYTYAVEFCENGNTYWLFANRKPDADRLIRLVLDSAKVTYVCCLRNGLKGKPPVKIYEWKKGVSVYPMCEVSA